MNILTTRGPTEQGMCLDALISLMLDSSPNQIVRFISEPECMLRLSLCIHGYFLTIDDECSESMRKIANIKIADSSDMIEMTISLVLTCNYISEN